MNRSARKRLDILNAAVDIFASTNFELASMDAIAAQAVVSKRTIYNHFASKDELFLAIVQRLKDDARQLVSWEHEPGLPPGGQLEAIGGNVVDFHCQLESRRLARVILPRLIQKPELGAELFGGAKLFEDELVRWLRSATASGQLKAMDCRHTAIQFLALLEAFSVWPQIFRGAPNPRVATRRKIVRSAVDMLIACHATRSGR